MLLRISCCYFPHTHVVATAKAMQSVHPTKTVADLARMVGDSHVRLPRISDAATEEYNDGVLLYNAEVLSLGLLWHGFHDTIREGDRHRKLCYWKFALVVFNSTKHCNYAKEAVNLLLQ